jgi:pyruvate dehydrogenase E2 component (dihydrolipoamide acetyltransferase)
MPIAIEMPKLSDTMTEGTLVRWIKKVGDKVAVGDVLAEVETDKATMEMEAFDEGVLTEIYVQDGNKVEVGQKLALLLAKGEKADSSEPKPVEENKVAPQAKEEKPATAPAKETAKGETPAAPQSQQNSEPEPSESAPTGRVKASPLAKKVAAELGVDLGAIQGSGPGGRIVREDVVAAGKSAPPAPPKKEAAPPPAAPKAPAFVPALEDKKIPLSGMRKAIASRLLESKTTAFLSAS